MKKVIQIALIVGLIVGISSFLGAQTPAPGSWGDSLSDGTRESVSTNQFNPGRFAFDSNSNTSWELATGSKDAWVERYWPSPQRIVSASVALSISEGTTLQLWYLSKDNWVPIPGGSLLGPQNGSIALTFPGELPTTTKVLVTLKGNLADRSKVYDISFGAGSNPAPYGKILPKTYTFNQPEYINLKADRLWDGIIGNSWFQPLWNKPSEVFNTNAANKPDKIFPPFNENPSTPGEIIWDLDGSYKIDLLKAYFVQDWRSVKFDFWNGSAWSNAQIIGEAGNHDQNTPWQRIKLATPIVTERVRITFPQGWSKASYLGEIEVWGAGYSDPQSLALVVPPKASDGKYHFTVNSAEQKDYEIEATVFGVSSGVLTADWNGFAFSAAPATWIGNETVYRFRVDKESIRPDVQFLKIGTTNVLRYVVVKKANGHGLVDLSWPYSDGQLENTVAGSGSPVPKIQSKVWDLGSQYQLEKLRVFVKNTNILDFKVRRIQDSNWVPVIWSTRGDGWWDADLSGVRADRLSFESTTPLAIDEIQLFGTALRDKKLGLEIWWPEFGVPVTAADNDDVSIIGWKGAPGAQIKIGDKNARDSDGLFWIPLKNLDMLSGEERAFLVQGESNGILTQKNKHVKWKSLSDAATLDQGSSLVSTSQNTIVLSGKVNDKNLRCFINNAEIALVADRFTTTVNLVDGFQLLNVEIWDKHKKKLKSVLSKPVHKTTGNVLLEFDQPPGNLYSQRSSMLLSGRVGNGIGLTLKMNGVQIPLTGNQFAQNVTLQSGINTFIFLLSDGAGRETSKTITINRDSVAPVITIVKPLANQYLTYSDVVLEANGGSDEPLWWNINNAGWEQGIGASISKAFTLSDGSHTFTVVAQDRAGNLSAPVSVSYFVDSQAPLPFEVESNVTTWTHSTNQIITFQTTDAASGISRYEFKTDEDASFRITSSPVIIHLISDGEHTITVRAIDRAGNVRVGTGIVKIDRTVPASVTNLRGVPGNAEERVRWDIDEAEFVSVELTRTPAWPNGARSVAVGDGKIHRPNEKPHYYNFEYVDSDAANNESYRYSVKVIDRATNTSGVQQSEETTPGLAVAPYNNVDGTLVEYSGATLLVSPGSLPSNVQKIVITEIVSPQMTALAEVPLASPIYRFGTVVSTPEGNVYQDSANFEHKFVGMLQYDPQKIIAGIPEARLGVYYFDTTWSRWVRVPEAVIDTDNHIVIFRTEHFTSFSVQPTLLEDQSPQALADVQFPIGSSTVKHAEVSISPQGGTVSTQMTEFVLPGRNGFNFELKRTFDSSTAKADTPGINVYASIDIYELIKDAPGTLEKIGGGIAGSVLAQLESRISSIWKNSGDYSYSMGNGWRLNLPYLRTAGGQTMIRTPSGSFYNILDMTLKNDGFAAENPFARALLLENHRGEDFQLLVYQLKSEMSISGLVSNIVAAKAGNPPSSLPSWSTLRAVLTTKDGSVYEFDALGRVTTMTDPSGKNKISVAYTAIFEDGGISIKSITDSLGRSINFEYHFIPNLNLRQYLQHIVLRDPVTNTERRVTYEQDGWGNLVSSTDVGGRKYSYQYKQDLIVSGQIGVKVNIIGLLRLIPAVEAIAGPILSKLGFTPVTIYGGFTSQIVHSMNVAEGPGIGRQAIDYAIQFIDYVQLQLTDYILGFIPTGVQFDYNYQNDVRPTKYYLRERNGAPTKKEVTYNYNFTYNYDKGKQVLNERSEVNDGRLRVSYNYTTIQVPRKRFITVSDELEALLLQLAQGQILEKEFKFEASFLPIESNSSSNDLTRGGVLVETTNKSYDTLLRPTSISTSRGPSVTSSQGFTYDNWGNVVYQLNQSAVGTHASRSETYKIYAGSSNVSGAINAMAASGIPFASHNPDIYDHDYIGRFDAEVLSLTKNFVPAAGTKPASTQWLAKVQTYTSQSLNQPASSSDWVSGNWETTRYAYNQSTAEMSSVLSPLGAQTTIVHDYSTTGSGVYTVKTKNVAVALADNTTTDIERVQAFNFATGYKIWERSGRGLVTTFTNDPMGRVTSITKPDDDAGETTWNPITTPVLASRTNNPFTTVTYDDNAFRVSVVKPRRQTESYQFDKLGKLSTIDRVIRSVREDGSIDNSVAAQHAVSTFVYDGFGQLVSYTNAVNAKTDFTYDGTGHLVKTEYPEIGGERSIKTSIFDHATNITTITDENGVVSFETMDWAGKLLSRRVATDSYGDVTEENWYDSIGNLVASHDKNGNFAYSSYNERQKPTQISKPVSEYLIQGLALSGPLLTTNEYNDDGFLVSETNTVQSVSQKVFHDRDSLGREIASRVLYTPYNATGIAGATSTARTLTFFDADNNVIKVIDPNNSGLSNPVFNSSIFSARDKKLSDTDQAGKVTNYRYDLDDNLVGMTDPRASNSAYTGDFAINYAYDDANRMIVATPPRVLGQTQSAKVIFAYDVQGRVLSRKDSTGKVTTYQYNARNWNIQEAQTLGSLTYTTSTSYDDVGNKISQVNPAGVETGFEYDDLRRLRVVSHPEGSESFAYDSNGNKVSSQSGKGYLTQFNYDALNRLTRSTDPKGKIYSYSYDLNGKPTKVLIL